MNSRARKTLAALFAHPMPRCLAFRDIEALLLAVGCTAVEGPGSAVGYHKDDHRASFHRPHPGKEAKLYQIKTARRFLCEIGVRP